MEKRARVPGLKVCVVGTWHLGSVVSACLSDVGFVVVGVGKDPKEIRNLNNAIPPVFEPGLRELLLKNIKSQRLSYTTEFSSGLKEAKYVLLTYDVRADSNGKIDLSDVFDASREMAKHLENGSVLIVSSQVPLGTCEKIKSTIKGINPSLDFDVACVPENVKLGRALEDFRHPKGMVIGAENLSTLDTVAKLFHFVDAPKINVNLRTAEMIKHVLNAFLSTSISFINEMANLCDKVGVDALKVTSALRLDERIGEKTPIRPGLGFSGGTLSRDVNVLRNLGRRYDCETHLMDAVLRVNERQNKLILKRLKTIYGSTRNLTIGVLGLTYKPGTSTLRHSVALDIIKDLTLNGSCAVKAYDPEVSLAEVKIHDFVFCTNAYDVAKDSDALVIVTAWPEFSDLDFDLVKSLMRNPVIIDAQNMLDANELKKKGLLYFGVGRGY